VARLKSWHAHTPVHTDEDVPETPPEELVSRLGEETLDFHEPDEDLKVEDLVPDLDLPSPEPHAERDELRWWLETALAGLPSAWREILLLRHVEGLPGSTCASGSSSPAAGSTATSRGEHARRADTPSGRSDTPRDRYSR
jgi:DNA-directed RNA polymerase specialized sigma24 family protein